ncbi:hypothetical protein BC941DRAFT_469665 [Chlamydoabsidia padenii]|nr:hypothetical protein BC941DRAFT_469665 [Chlamydoabsidia padenii]
MLSRSLLRLSTRPHVRQLHVSALCLAENNGVFGRFNPWAKKTPESNTTTTTEGTNENTPIESIGNVTFDVAYHDDQKFSSWKNTNVIEDINEIQSSIRSIVSEHIQGLSDANWKEASLKDANLKFKVVKESIKQTGKEVPNLELTNITTVNDLLEFYGRVPDVSQTSVEKFFMENADTLPSNLTFEVPTKASS